VGGECDATRYGDSSLDNRSSMLTAIIAAHESERTLVPTLAALVPGATAGVVSEVIVADGGSHDATAEVSDFAGCRLISSKDPVGARLKSAAAKARAPWLLFLRAGCVPEPGWIQAVECFTQGADLAERAAVFRPPGIAVQLRPGLAELFAVFRLAFGGGPKPEQGLLIARRFYDALGGHDADDGAEVALLCKLGRRRIAMLACAASPPHRGSPGGS
jgi:glycosyltransferase involved in cell wall biosynthesis